MKSLFGWSLFVLASANSFGQSYGLKSLRCIPVSGHTYAVEIGEFELLLIESWVDTKASKSSLIKKVRHAFPLDSCVFTPFSVALECGDPAQKEPSVQIALKRASEKSTSHELQFRIGGLPEMQSKVFETKRVEMGKAARCVVNETYEIL